MMMSISHGGATDSASNTNSIAQTPVEAVRRYLESLPQDIPVKEELLNFRFWKAIRAEILSTLLLVIFTSNITTSTNHISDTIGAKDNNSNVIEIKGALALGFTVATLVQCFGNLSGGHCNPAVTLSLLVTRHISPLRFVAYTLSQCIGALMGGAILYGLTPLDSGASTDGSSDGPVSTLHTQDVKVHLSQAFGVEFLSTLLVVVTVLANLEPTRVDLGFKSLSIGLAYSVGHLFGFRWTGASMNPARSLGTAVITNHWRHHWIYWVGPMLGSLIGAITYEYTHDSTSHVIRRSFRRQPTRPNKRRCATTEPLKPRSNEPHENNDVGGAFTCQEAELTTELSNDCRV